MSQHIESTTTNLHHGQALYNGEIGRCQAPGCNHRGQLQGGVCLACRQAAERAHPTRRPPVRRCQLCQQPLPANAHYNRRYCPACATERHNEGVAACHSRARRVAK